MYPPLFSLFVPPPYLFLFSPVPFLHFFLYRSSSCSLCLTFSPLFPFSLVLPLCNSIMRHCDIAAEYPAVPASPNPDTRMLFAKQSWFPIFWNFCLLDFENQRQCSKAWFQNLSGACHFYTELKSVCSSSRAFQEISFCRSRQRSNPCWKGGNQSTVSPPNVPWISLFILRSSLVYNSSRPLVPLWSQMSFSTLPFLFVLLWTLNFKIGCLEGSNESLTLQKGFQYDDLGCRLDNQARSKRLLLGKTT